MRERRRAGRVEREERARVLCFEEGRERREERR